MDEEVFTKNNFEIIAFALDQEAVYYNEPGWMFGGDQIWFLVSKSKSTYFFYESVLESPISRAIQQFEYPENYGWPNPQRTNFTITKTRARLILSQLEYRKIAEIPVRGVRLLLYNGMLLDVVKARNFPHDAVMKIKEEEGIGITAEDILNVENLEVQQRLLSDFGYEALCKQVQPDVLDIDLKKNNRLIKIKNIVLADVQDGTSKDKRYLLRVPPEMVRINQAIAWTFNLTEEEYQPLVET